MEILVLGKACATCLHDRRTLTVGNMRGIARTHGSGKRPRGVIGLSVDVLGCTQSVKEHGLGEKTFMFSKIIGRKVLRT